MPNTFDEDEFGDDEQESDEREHPDAAEADWNLDPDVVECPYCRKEISEDAASCPYCKQYISQEDAPPSRKPLWIVIGLAAVGVILLWWIFLIR